MEGRPSLVIGLTLEDLEPLKPGEGGHWMKVDLEELGLDLQLTLLVEESNEKLAEQIEKMKWTMTVN